jgi:probable phosphoglycerate mutase
MPNSQKPTDIILIRHGETAWNADRRLQGHIDIALNDEGERQAQALGAHLQDAPLAAIISSDLQRAWQTAQAVARWHALPLQKEPGLRERCFGGFEGLTYDEIGQRFPVEFASWHGRDLDAPLPPGLHQGETFRSFNQRVMHAIEQAASRYPGQTIALVAHGGVLECAYRNACAIALDSPRQFPVLNASINRLSWHGGKLSLQSWGECEHLSRLPMSLDEVERVVV